jgi:hypothetical protein
VWGFEHWSVAWILIEKVQNATSGNARRHTSGQSLSARTSVGVPISGARKIVSGTIESGETDDPSCEVQARHRSRKTAVPVLRSPWQGAFRWEAVHRAQVSVPRVPTTKTGLKTRTETLPTERICKDMGGVFGLLPGEHSEDDGRYTGFAWFQPRRFDPDPAIGVVGGHDDLQFVEDLTQYWCVHDALVTGPPL